MNQTAVIIPCYNLGRFVEEAVDSVLTQTAPVSEIVVVDDGSTDLYTRQVLTAVEKSGIRLVRTSNRGAAAARNEGIRMTSAPYLITLDADDKLHPLYLEETAARLEAEPNLGFVSTAYQTFGDASYVWTPPACELVTALTEGSAHVASIFRRTLWEAVGGFDETFQTAEDLDFWIMAMEMGFRGEIIDKPLLWCRVRNDSKHQRNVASGGHRRAREAILQKHSQTIERLGPELFLAKEAFLSRQRAHLSYLDGKISSIEREVVNIESEIANIGKQLSELGLRSVDWGDLRRLQPISPVWGLDRGKPLDRYYIEKFLEKHKADIQGRVLEIKESHYTRYFGGNQVKKYEVLDIDGTNPNVTIIADLTNADHVPSDSFDCFILTQTLHIIYDVRAALRHAFRILNPGGVLLSTLPAVSRINYEDGGLDHGDCWRFTEFSVRKLFAEVFPLESFEVTGFGNVMACTAFLYGLSPQEFDRGELDYVDPWFPLIFTVRAVKPRSM